MAINWTPLHGNWQPQTNGVKYLGNHPSIPVGLILGSQRVRNGHFGVKVRFRRGTSEREARLVFRCDANTEEYFAAGLGGWRYAYCLHFGRGLTAFTLVTGSGSSEVLSSKDEYQISVHIAGRIAVLTVDGNEVLSEILPRDLAGDRLGLYAYGGQEVEFTELRVSPYKPKAFVIMQFGEPFDSLYDAVIQTAANKAGFDVHRADRTLGPGSIPEDIIRNMIDADVVIAEISPTPERGFNPNVFYELGYAHSLAKPTIMLAREVAKLPFDIHHLRCIPYEDSSDGRSKLQDQLQKHLEASVTSAY